MSDEKLNPLEEFRRAMKAIEDLAPRLERLAEVHARQLEMSSQVLASLRGAANGQLITGPISLSNGAAGDWSWSGDWKVPFASIAYCDSGKFGPFYFSTDGARAATGPGAFTSFGSDSGTVPLIGRHLDIVSLSASATPPTLFLVVSTEPADLSIN